MACASVIKQQDLGLLTQVETISSPVLSSVHFTYSTDFSFAVKSTLNEIQVEQDAGLPFRIRLKALLHALTLGLPHSFPTFEWKIPPAKMSGDQLPLSVENIERVITFKEMAHVWGGEVRKMPHSAHFRIRATETLEAHLARK